MYPQNKKGLPMARTIKALTAEEFTPHGFRTMFSTIAHKKAILNMMLSKHS